MHSLEKHAFHLSDAPLKIFAVLIIASNQSGSVSKSLFRYESLGFEVKRHDVKPAEVNIFKST
jgi:hypothetical protein